jgi:hypothetical protein
MSTQQLNFYEFALAGRFSSWVGDEFAIGPLTRRYNPFSKWHLHQCKRIACRQPQSNGAL